MAAAGAMLSFVAQAGEIALDPRRLEVRGKSVELGEEEIRQKPLQRRQDVRNGHCHRTVPVSGGQDDAVVAKVLP